MTNIEFIPTDELIEKVKEYPKITNSIVKVLVPDYEKYRQSTPNIKCGDFNEKASNSLADAITPNGFISKRDFIDSIEKALDSYDDEETIDISISDDYVEVYSTRIEIISETNTEILSRLAKVLRLLKKDKVIKDVTKKFDLDKVIPNDISKEDINAMIIKLQMLQANKS